MSAFYQPKSKLMTSEERDLINGLFDRLRRADASNPAPKDREAEGLISQLTGQLASAPYLLAQTVLVQEHALNNAQGRIRQLEQDLARAREAQQRQGQQAAEKPSGVGGFLSGLFGQGSASQQQPPAQPPQYGQPPAGQTPPPMPAQPAQPSYAPTANLAPGAGGGFLKGALATAAGVAGGAMLFQGIQNLLGHNAGPFGGGLGGFGGGGGGFLNTGFGGHGNGGPDIIENTEVTNNYYGDNVPEGVGGHQAHPGQEESRYEHGGSGQGPVDFDDRGFDASNPFDKPDDLTLSDGRGAIDNNYDADNSDANGGFGLDNFASDDSGNAGDSDDNYA